MQIVHGGKFGTKHKSKCGLYRTAIFKDGDLCLWYIDGIDKVTCRKCIALHQPRKC
jgi:hypothetical protein